MTAGPQYGELPEGFVIDEEPSDIDLSQVDRPWLPSPPQAVTLAAPQPGAPVAGPGVLDVLRAALTAALGIPAAEAAVRGGSSPAPQPAPAPAQPPPVEPASPEMAPQPTPVPAQPAPGQPAPTQPPARPRPPPPELPARLVPPPQPSEDEIEDRQELERDSPTAEPIDDLIAQSRDLVDAENRRQALYLSKANREALAANQAAAAMLADEFGRLGIDIEAQGLDDFDGQGGLVIVPDERHRMRAERLLERGQPVGEIIGTLIGAGRGKPSPYLPDGSPAPLRVVQQVTPIGAVSLERVVATDEEEAAALRQFALPGRTVRTVSPEQALQRRAQRIEAGAQDEGTEGLASMLGEMNRADAQPAAPGSPFAELIGAMTGAEAQPASAPMPRAAAPKPLPAQPSATLPVQPTVARQTTPEGAVAPARVGEIDGDAIIGFDAPEGRVRLQSGREIAVTNAGGVITMRNGARVPPARIAAFQNGGAGSQWVPVGPAARQAAATPEAGGGDQLFARRSERFTPAFRQRMPDAAAAVERELRRMLPKDVALRVLPRIGDRRMGFDIAAMFEDRDGQQIVSVAMTDGPEVAKVKGFHEVAAHALRGGKESLYRSLYTDAEWRLLLDKAKETGALPASHLKSYLSAYKRAAREAGMEGPELRRHVAEWLDQERVGALAERWIEGADFGPKVNALLARILKFLEAVRNALNGLGFETAEDVFERVVSGEIAERGNKRDGRLAKAAAGERTAPLDEPMRDEAVRAGREQRAALERMERPREEQRRPKRAEAEPDLDSMDTFELRHLAKDMGLPDNQWRGRRATEIRDAIRSRDGQLYAVSEPPPAPPRTGPSPSPSPAPSGAPPAAAGGGASSGGGSGGSIPDGGGRGSTPGGPPPSGPERRSLLLQLIPSAPLDRVMRLPFDIFGGTDQYGRWRPGIFLSDKAASLITKAEFSDSGRFAFLNPVLHKARSGLVDRYGLDPAYVERDRQRALEERRVASGVREIMARLRDAGVGAREAKVLHDILTGEAVADADMARLAEPIRNAVDEMGQIAVDIGILSAEAYERNKGTYLHRVYLKHEADQGGLVRLVNGIMGSRRKKIIGEELKGRGLWITVSPGALARFTPEAQAARKGSAEIGRLGRRMQDLRFRRMEAVAAAKELTAEGKAHFERRLDVADAATVGTEAEDVRRPSSFQKGQVREQGVALNRLLDKRRRGDTVVAKIDSAIAEVEARIADAAARLPGAIVPENGDRFIVLDRADTDEGADLTLEEAQARDTTRRRRGHRVYVRAGEAIPEKYAGYERRGVWEVRGTRRGKVILWRDFTKPEREAMGEITDARYTIAKTFMLMAHDLAVGRFYKDISENPDWATAEEPEGTWVNAGEYRYRGLGDDRELEWVRVPDTTIPKSATKRYGALAGKWVRAEIWRDIAELERMQTSGWWNDLLTQWKLNKTARSPVVHMNNVMSNAVLMDMADVRARDLVRGIRSLAKGDALYREAAEAGAFGADMVAQEIRRDVLQPILEEIERGVMGDRGPMESVIGVYGRVFDAIWSRAKSLDRKMVSLYQLEDEVFRMATFIRRREQGMDSQTAAIEAKDQFLDYDIRAPWVNAARRSVLPFISYSYRAIPIIAKTVMTRPWKLAKYATVAYALNALAYALLPGDDGEDKERRSMREELEGYTWIGAPRMLRTPWADEYGNPIFLDVRRWIPAGDVFDLNQSHGAIPLPSWLSLGGPLLMGAELALNKQSFTGREIINERTADWWDRSSAVSDYLWKSWMPSAAWVPGSWYWTSVGTAINSRLQIPALSALGWGTEPRDRQGNLLNPATAALSSVGVKVKPQDVQEGFWLWGLEFQRVERDLRAEARRIGRDRARGLISQEQMDRQMTRVTGKLERLGRDAQRRIEGERRPQPRAQPGAVRPDIDFSSQRPGGAELPPGFQLDR